MRDRFRGIVRGGMRRSATVALATTMIAGCATPVTLVPPPSPPSAPVAVASPVPTGLSASPTSAPIPGPVALPFAAYLVASDGDLVAAVRLDASPGASRTEIFVSELSQAPASWRSIAVFDAFPTGLSVANGRIAVGVRRESPQGGGAFSAEIVVIDAASGARRSIWSGSFSAATFRGGGGGPKRASEKFVLRANSIAYVGLTEFGGGDLTGELRIRRLTVRDDGVVYERSPRWIEPVVSCCDELVYAVDGDPLDEVILSHDDYPSEVIARAPHIRAHASSGRWLLYNTGQNEQAGPYRVVLRDIVNGAERDLDTNGDRLSLSATQAVWRSNAGGSPTVRILDLPIDLKDLTEARIVQSRPSLIDVMAVPGGVLTHDISGGFSTIALLALR